MRKVNIIISLVFVVILSGCVQNETTINFNNFEEETTTFEPVNEEQHYSNFNQINITEMEGISGITEADIYLPIPKDAVWDAETKTYTMPDNYVNENGESFIMTISLEPLPKGKDFISESMSVSTEMENLREQDWKKYNGSFYLTEDNIVVKCLRTMVQEEPPESGETIEKLKQTVSYSIEAYDFLEPSFYLHIELEIVKLRGTVDDTTQEYYNALRSALEKFKYHFKQD